MAIEAKSCLRGEVWEDSERPCADIFGSESAELQPGQSDADSKKRIKQGELKRHSDRASGDKQIIAPGRDVKVHSSEKEE